MKENMDLTYISDALTAEDEYDWKKSQYKWEMALIETVKAKKEDWYGSSLVILCHIYGMMEDFFEFKKSDSRIAHNYKPVGHWKDVELNEDRIEHMKSSKLSIIFRIVLAIILLFVFFLYISYPFGKMETNILAVSLIVSVGIIGIIVGLMTNLIAGFISLIISSLADRGIAKLLRRIFQFPDLDIGYLWIIRIMVLVIAIALISTAIKDHKNSKDVTKLSIRNERESNNLKIHSNECLNAVNEIAEIIFEDDLFEVAAVKAKNAYIEADIFGFNHVDTIETIDIVYEVIAMRDYYQDMTKKLD